jgi:hypothetical protein
MVDNFIIELNVGGVSFRGMNWIRLLKIVQNYLTS